jgi:dipeptidyl aminopeptidase/acylaminoacyl peptidase
MKKLLLLIACIILFCCEPISVSVNSQQEIAFTRKEGVFFLNYKTSALTTLNWTFNKESLPIIVRWSPDSKFVAFTMKSSSSAMSTEVYLVERNGMNLKELFISEKVITQLEWSPDGNYLSYAQQGEDSELGVADIGFYNFKTMENNLIIKNSSDVHRWYDKETVIFFSIFEKNPNNTEMFKAYLTFYNLTTDAYQNYIPAIVNKNGNFDCHSNHVYFIAYKIIEIEEFSEDLTDTYLYQFILNENSLDKFIAEPVNFVKLSPDKKNLLHTLIDSDSKKLATTKIGTKATNVIVNDIELSVNTGSAGVMAYPEWLDNNNVLFFDISNNYGSSGQAMRLFKVDISTKKMENMQITIDSLIDKNIKERGGY